MQFADLHTHTKLCRHADGEPADYLRYAGARNLRFFGVSDHFPAPAGYDALYRMKPEELSLYRQIVSSLKKEAEMNGGPEILYACEFDYVPGRMREVYDLLDKEPFDYTIGSIHYVDGFAFDDPDLIDGWEKTGADKIWERYLELMFQFVSECRFQIMAHPDLPKKFGYFYSSRKKLLSSMYEIFQLAAKKDICIEINTAGLRVPANEMYPAPDLLKLAHDAGCSITFGSDAHKPELVAANFEDARKAAEAAGFHSIRAFRKGIPLELPFC